MKHTNAYQELNIKELETKKREFVKDLLTSRLTLDVTALTTASNLQNLLRELKLVNRAIANKRNAIETQKELG